MTDPHRRLKFAYARGARIQVRELGAWFNVSSPFWHLDLVRIHPSDAHLEYGPLSGALRDAVIDMASAGLSTVVAAKYACGGVLGEDAFGCHQFMTVVEREFFFLFLAEALADEGL